MAEVAKCQPPQWQLIEAPPTSGASAWLALKRFDYVTEQASLSGNRSSGRLHMHSACGLLDADFRTPSLDYIDLIKASRQLCKSPLLDNCNFAVPFLTCCRLTKTTTVKLGVLQADDGQWNPAPFTMLPTAHIHSTNTPLRSRLWQSATA